MSKNKLVDNHLEINGKDVDGVRWAHTGVVLKEGVVLAGYVRHSEIGYRMLALEPQRHPQTGQVVMIPTWADFVGDDVLAIKTALSDDDGELLNTLSGVFGHKEDKESSIMLS